MAMPLGFHIRDSSSLPSPGQASDRSADSLAARYSLALTTQQSINPLFGRVSALTRYTSADQAFPEAASRNLNSG